MESLASAPAGQRAEGGRAALMALGLLAAVALRGTTGGADPASSATSSLLFAAALFALVLAAGVRPARPSLAALSAGILGGTVLVGGWLVGRPALVLHFQAAPTALLLWTPAVALIALAEEGLLRGALFSAIEQQSGTAVALALTSVAFALMHVPLYGLGALPLDLAAGLWLGGLRVLTGGFAAPAVAHVLADLATGWLG